MGTVNRVATTMFAGTSTILLLSSTADANIGLQLETISDYTYVCGGSTTCNTDADTEGSGFWIPMTAPGSPWSGNPSFGGSWRVDSSVADTDFYDPDLTGHFWDDDTYKFDTATTALSFVIAHGSCNDIAVTPCSSNSNCGANGYCPDFPIALFSEPACINKLPRVIKTSSPNSSNGNLVTYGDGSLSFALGEGSTGGGYNHAGVNGGTNVVIITNSCGFRSHYVVGSDVDNQNFFGGMHELMFNMPVGNVANGPFTDVVGWAARGSTLANLILTNLSAPAKDAWLNPSMVTNSYVLVGASNRNSPTGANVVKAKDVTAAAAQSRLQNETWVQTLSDTLDSTSNVYGHEYYTCNFTNCSSYSL